jgi:hypothetical protein
MLIALVWSWMYVTRIREIRTKRVPVQVLADRTRAVQALKDVAGPSDNLINLFELPVLFYVVIIVLYVTGRGDEVYLTMAWVYVLLRAAHSFIHCTYNRVMHRFSVYMLSSVVLWVMWARLALQFLSAV